ncbi:MAG: hypothetical protein AAGA67_14105, partial [Cyanobacteria bacterium P01_F01_bin.153]
MASCQQLKRWAGKRLLKSTAGLLIGVVIAQMPAKIAAQDTTSQEGAAPETLREAVEAEDVGDSEGLQQG